MKNTEAAEDSLLYKIGLGLIPKIGPVLAKRLIAYCGSAEAVFREKKTPLSKIPGIGEKLADYIIKNKNLASAEDEITFIKKHHIQALFYLDDTYPSRLKNCEDSPVILYFKGNAELNRTRILSIVGTRNPTDYGRGMTRELIAEIALSYSDMLIVSGLAYGIDICAHKASLKHRIDTVGVLGHGLSVIYPSAHRESACTMVEKGGLITEFLHNEKPESPNFIKRNRIIAGMSDATIVMESGEQGGALITADIANSYNRDVFAFPGKVNDKYSTGCNRLIKNNQAALVESLRDIEYMLGWQKSEINTHVIQKELFIELSPDEKVITGLLKNGDNTTIDILAIKSDLPVSKLSGLLLNLEFKGLVKCLPGNVYRLA